MVSMVSDAAEQQVIHDRLVVESDVGGFGGNAENDVEVSDWQQVGLGLGQPCACGGDLALATVPVAAAVMGDPLMPAVLAVLAGLDMTAQSRRAAMLDRRHDLELMKAQVSAMGGPISGAGSTEDVGNLERGAHRLSRWGRVLNMPSLSSGLVTLRTVRVATLV
jgi:hypothetical protein